MSKPGEGKEKVQITLTNEVMAKLRRYLKGKYGGHNVMSGFIESLLLEFFAKEEGTMQPGIPLIPPPRPRL